MNFTAPKHPTAVARAKASARWQLGDQAPPRATLGRITYNPEPLAADLLTPDQIAADEAAALGDLVFARTFDRIAAALIGQANGHPRLEAILLERVLGELAVAQPEHAERCTRELTERRSRHWPDRESEYEADQHMPEYKPDAPPPPERERHSDEYLAACRSVVAELDAAQIKLAVLDPLNPDSPPRHYLDKYALGEDMWLSGEGAQVMALIEHGYVACWAPYARVAVPPTLKTKGVRWEPEPQGRCFLLVVES